MSGRSRRGRTGLASWTKRARKPVCSLARRLGFESLEQRRLLASGVFLSADPFDLTKQDLVINGTAGNDVINITPASGKGTVPASGGSIVATMNGATYGPFAATGRIVVYTNSGNDAVTVSPAIYLQSWLMAGNGNDTLSGGSGNNVLVGGGGRCTLTGGAGRNLVIAGSGSSRLFGGQPYSATSPASGGSIMVGGSTIYDGNAAALNAILQEWSSTDSYVARMQKIQSSVGPSGVALAMNGPAPAILKNHVVDQIFSSCGMDWFWNVSGLDQMSNPQKAQVNATAPGGYSIAADQTWIGSSMAASTGFTFSEATTGDTCRYSVTSTGGGTAVAGSVAVTSATQDVKGINVSSLRNGTLTYSATLTDTAGNVGPAATVTATLDTVAPVATVNALTTNKNKPTLAGTVSDAAPSSGIAGVTVVVNGQTLTATVNGTTWSAVEGTALADGTYSVQVTAKDEAGNSTTISGIGALVVNTLVAPSGYSITPNLSTYNLTTGKSAAFTITAAEVGTTLRYVVAGIASGQLIGEVPVTSPTQTVMLGDITSFSPGTVSFAVQLVDAAGHKGPEVQALATLNTTVPPAFSIEAPATISLFTEHGTSFICNNAEIQDTYAYSITGPGGSASVTVVGRGGGRSP